MVATVSSLFSDKPLHVLTPDLSQRIAAVNQCRDQLRQQGFQVVRQALRQGDSKPPLLTVAVPAGDAALRLRGLAKAVRMAFDDDGAVWIARISGVDVQWPATPSQ